MDRAPLVRNLPLALAGLRRDASGDRHRMEQRTRPRPSAWPDNASRRALLPLRRRAGSPRRTRADRPAVGRRPNAHRRREPPGGPERAFRRAGALHSAGVRRDGRV